MALALMCSKWMPNSPRGLRIFIVDHEIRPGSSAEAQKVRQLIKKHCLGKSYVIRQAALFSDILDAAIRGKILKLQSAVDSGPIHWGQNLETQARKLRYQTLGRACRDHKVSYLLLGHHEDDQYETVLGRLAQGHRYALSGMQANTKIPENHENYGISESGYVRTLPVLQKHQYWKNRGWDFSDRVRGIETGGVHILRPLLGFSKDRLMATCRYFDVPWIEDESNLDQTLTPRNAIRCMIKNHKLPAALSKENLLRMSERIKQRNEQIQDLANKAWDACDVRLEVRNGTARIRFPRPGNLSSTSADVTNVQIGRFRTIAAILLRKACLLVSHDCGTLTDYDLAIDYVLNSASKISADIRAGQRKPSFEAGGVYFMGEQDREATSHTPFLDSWVWTLRRAQYQYNSLRGMNSHPDNSPSLNIRVPGRAKESVLPYHQSEFQLWDGRFWIAVRNPFEHDLWIRPLKKDHLMHLYTLAKSESIYIRIPEHGIRNGTFRQLREHFSKIAPGDSRFTLPIIEGPAVPGYDLPIVLAIPTLGIRIDPRDYLGRFLKWPQRPISWEVRYKSVDLGSGNWEDRLEHETEIDPPKAFAAKKSGIDFV